MTEELEGQDLCICPSCGRRHCKVREDLPYRLTSNLVCDVREDDDEEPCECVEQETLQPWQKNLFIVLAVAVLVIVIWAFILNRGG